MNAHHLNILAVLDYAPAWTGSPCAPGTNCPPANPTLFANFATAAAKRYTPLGVTKWEIWNEPNNAAFWGGKINCGAYSSDLKLAYIAIKAVNPNAGIISGGLAPESTDGLNMSPTDFLSCLYQNNDGGYFDAIGDHPYTYPEMPSASTPNAWGQMSETARSLRSLMIANGDAGKRIWITKFGTPTNGPDPASYISQAQQATMVTTAINLYETYPWAGPLFWYTFRDNGTSTTDNQNFFGLTNFDGSTKPAYATLKNLIAAGL